MIRVPICPVCGDLVVDQPFESWATAYQGGAATWWHLADNTPICPAEDGRHSPPVFVEDQLPVDMETNPWIDAMSVLFAIDGPHDPARLGSAIIAAEHLHRWLHTATGPFSALMTLPTPSGVAHLVGYLHRTARLLARIHVQAGTYIHEQARQSPFTGLDDHSDSRGDVIDRADEVQTLLYDAADWSAQSAQAAGGAWSHARKVAALTARTGADEHAYPAPSATASNTDPEPTSPDVPQEPTDLSPAHLAELIGSAFDGEAGFSPDLTRTATRLLGTLTTYLSNCLGPARPIALPTPQDLANLTTSLTYLTNTFHTGLRHVVERPTDSDTAGLDETHKAALHAMLASASEALRRAAQDLAAASYHAASLDLPAEAATTSGSQDDKASIARSDTTLVDRTFGEHRQGYDLTEIRRTDGNLLRVRIHRDAYQHQSYALVEVFTPAMTWNPLATEPASTWHAGTPYRSTSPAPLEHLAERLFQRADVILRAE